MEELKITQGSLKHINDEEKNYLIFCCNLQYVDYVTVITNYEKRAEFWLFLKKYTIETTDDIMRKCLDYLDEHNTDFDMIFLTEDQVDKKLMPPIRVTAERLSRES